MVEKVKKNVLLQMHVVSIISQALVIFKIDPFFVQIFLGFMILLAVFINRYREYREERRTKVFSDE